MKEWYCLFRGRKEGPFSVSELRRHPRFCPDTLVWKKGFPRWVKASKIREFEKMFKEEQRRSQGQKKKGKKSTFRGAEILTSRLTPPPYLLFLFVLIVIVFFVFYLYYL